MEVQDVEYDSITDLRIPISDDEDGDYYVADESVTASVPATVPAAVQGDPAAAAAVYAASATYVVTPTHQGLAGRIAQPGEVESSPRVPSRQVSDPTAFSWSPASIIAAQGAVPAAVHGVSAAAPAAVSAAVQSVPAAADAAALPAARTQAEVVTPVRGAVSPS